MIRLIKLVIVAAMVALMLSVGTAQACACGGGWNPATQQEVAAKVATYHNQLPYEWRVHRAYSLEVPPGYYYNYAYLLVPLG